MFILDTDALIYAFRYDFPPDTNPGSFWDWLLAQGEVGNIKIPESVFEEVERGYDGLADLLGAFKETVILPTTDALPNLQIVLDTYANPLTEEDLETINMKADPYLAAHALSIGNGATVVTNEAPNPNITLPCKKKIPTICECLSIPCVRYPRFLWNVRNGF